jgi:hypothetical protein
MTEMQRSFNGIPVLECLASHLPEYETAWLRTYLLTSRKNVLPAFHPKYGGSSLLRNNGNDYETTRCLTLNEKKTPGL